MRTPDNPLERQENGSYGSLRGRGGSRMLRRWGNELKSGGALALFGVYRGGAKAARGSVIAKNFKLRLRNFYASSGVYVIDADGR
jgi:hypothetical protein